MTEVSFLPILAAGVVSTLMGWAWYHPKVFGTAWMRMSGMTPEMAERGKKRMPLSVVVAFLASMVVAYVMSYFAIAWGVYDWIGAIELGLWTWIGFVAPPMLGVVLWEHKPIRLYFINALYWLVAFIIIALVLLFGSRELIPNIWDGNDAHTGEEQNSVLPERVIELGGQPIRVSVADTPEARKTGLGNRAGLAPGEGMLFVFPYDGIYGFWMENMQFSIDILWLNVSGEIVHIEESVSPETYPAVFSSKVRARYVLELPAGFVSGYEVRVGDIVRL